MWQCAPSGYHPVNLYLWPALQFHAKHLASKSGTSFRLNYGFPLSITGAVTRLQGGAEVEHRLTIKNPTPPPHRTPHHCGCILVSLKPWGWWNPSQCREPWKGRYFTCSDWRRHKIREIQCPDWRWNKILGIQCPDWRQNKMHYCEEEGRLPKC